MYLDYWKLVRRPFDESIDPDWYFPSGVHQGIVLHMRSIIDQRQPLALLAGAVGSGKSMVVANVADQCVTNCQAVTLRVSAMTVAHALEGILAELHHGETPRIDRPATQTDSIELTELLKRQLARCQEASQHIVALLDPTTDMPENELGNLARTLATLGGAYPLTTFIVGPTDLLVKTSRLARRDGPSFPQCVLSPMAPADTALYIRHRMLRAGGDPTIFSDAAVELIHELCGGLPRRINRLSDLCLLIGYSQNCDPITHSLVWTAQSEIRVLAPSRTPRTPHTRRWRPLGRMLKVSI